MLLSFYYFNFLKNFLYDKFFYSNIYQTAKLLKLYVIVNVSRADNSKSIFYKLLVLLYLWSGRKPFISIKKYRLKSRGIKKKQVSNIGVLLRKKAAWGFLHFLLTRQLPLIDPVRIISVKKNKFFSITFNNYINDDDILLRALDFRSSFTLNLSLYFSNIADFQKFKTILYGLKIPIKIF